MKSHLGIVSWRLWIPGFIITLDLDVVTGFLVPKYHLYLNIRAPFCDHG